MQPPDKRQVLKKALIVRATVGWRDIHNHSSEMWWTFDSSLPLDDRAIGTTNRSYLARTPGLARQPFNSVEAVRSFAHPRFELPLGAEASPHVLNGVNITSHRPEPCLRFIIRFVVGRSLEHNGQAVRRAIREV